MLLCNCWNTNWFFAAKCSSQSIHHSKSQNNNRFEKKHCYYFYMLESKKMFCSGKSINGWSSMSQADAHLFIHNHLSVVEIKINLTFIWLDWILCAWRSSFQFVILEKNQFILFWIENESDTVFFNTEFYIIITQYFEIINLLLD